MDWSALTAVLITLAVTALFAFWAGTFVWHAVSHVARRLRGHTVQARLLDFAARLEPFYRRSSYPKDLLQNEDFLRGVKLMSRSGYSAASLLDHVVGSNVILACMALEALAHRRDDVEVVEPILANVNKVHLWTSYFALRALSARAREPILGAVLLQLDADWTAPLQLRILREFIAERLAAGETPTFGERIRSRSDTELDAVATIIDRLRDDIPAALRDEIRRSREGRIDLALLGSIGRVWRPGADDTTAASSAAEAKFRQLEEAIGSGPPRSVALVGEPGVGKTTLIRQLAARLQSTGWTVFEATAADLLAGQVYIGQLEGRIQALVQAIRGKDVLWVVPRLQELLWAGRHSRNPVGVLELILPHLESGEVKLIGEVEAKAYERLVQAEPRVRTALAAVRLDPLGESETLELARHWIAQQSPPSAPPLISEQTLHEAFQLAKQYLSSKSSPGNLLQFLELTHQRTTTGKDGAPLEISLDDLLATLSQLTGLPLDILDERTGLDLARLRAFFAARIIGQPEAVECLVERIAMIKAGVVDPTRPFGVFLFVGPTGTGKTEIAKALTECLFGSADRMIRLDMSEFQTPESVHRILGESGDVEASTALVNLIRKQPFSVVLLDEFEKANPSVWDLFLQVFDDGRLSDRQGNVADFRHCVVIMTSNLGATLPFGASIGFAQEQAHFAPASVERAVAQAFRREFVNRIDRIVVFRPLGRVEMREILRKELADVLQRRAFRRRTWAVEWDESALDFLLEKGFTADLGARPLKRAVERYVLAPLALTIANHQAPEGDQFLFVRSSAERIAVEFIDPDAPDEEVAEPAPPEPVTDGWRIEAIVLNALGTAAEIEFLEGRYEQLATRLEESGWEERKEAVLAEMKAPGFWESPRRFAALGLAEYMDRIDVGLETAASMLRRLVGSHRSDRTRYRRELVQRLAQQLYLLDAAQAGLAAGQPRDAFLLVRASRDSSADMAIGDRFAERLGAMYRQWAARRRMRIDVLEETQGSATVGYQLLLAICGFAAYPILRLESGLHVLQIPHDQRAFSRVKARVMVVPQPDEPSKTIEQARSQAMHLIATGGRDTGQLIVRRYREEPSPLVRDSVRRWRSGRLDRVLAGEFDVIV